VLPADDVRAELEPVDAECLDSELSANEADSATGAGGLDVVEMDDGVPDGYIRKTPKVVSGTGAFAAAANPSARTRLVSSGSMMPSSQSRAVE